MYDVVATASDTSREAAVRVWAEAGFGSADVGIQNARYDWWYLDNPAGQGEANFLTHEGREVGFLGVGQRAWNAMGRAIKAAVLVDFVVLPAHRTAAPALLLQRRGRERALQSVEFLLGLPDTKAVPIFKRLGSVARGPLPRYARVVRHAPYIARRWPHPGAGIASALLDFIDGVKLRISALGSSLRSEWVVGPDGRFDQLWARVQSHALAGCRDARFLKWRFSSQPGTRYEFLAVFGKRSEDLKMYFVCERVGETLVVKDCLGDAGADEWKDGLLHLARAARRMSMSSISLQARGNPELDKALKPAGFVFRSSRDFYVICNASASTAIDAQAIYLTQADEDI